MRLIDLGDLALILWAVPAIAAPVLYWRVRDTRGRLRPWRRDATGVHLFAFMAAYAFLGVLGLVRLATGSGALWWQALRAAGFAALIVVTWWRLYLIWQAWRENRRAAELTKSPPGR